MSMSMLSRWTIGAIASKKARASAPVAAPIDSARLAAVSGPVATIVAPEGGGRAPAPPAPQLRVRMAGAPLGQGRGEALAVDGEPRSGRHPVLVRRRHD